MPKKKPASVADLPAEEIEEPIEEPISLVDDLPIADDDLDALHEAAMRGVRALVNGVWVVYTVKKAKLLRGESEWELTTDTGATIYAYKQLPDLDACKVVIKKKDERDTVKEQTIPIAVKIAIPGKDDEVNTYLASLPDEILAKYDYDAETLATIKSYRKP